MVTTGGRDIFAVAIAISGMVAVGPIELFFPSAAGAAFGTGVWPLLAFLYFLFVSLVILSSRPKLVVYGAGPSAVMSALLEAAKKIDPNAKSDVDGGQIELPESGLHLRVEGYRYGDWCDIQAFESNVTPMFWRRLLVVFRDELRQAQPANSSRGVLSFTIGISLLVIVSVSVFSAPTEVVQDFRQWIWR